MKRLVTGLLASMGVLLGVAGCASQESATVTETQNARLGAGDALGWQLHSGDRAVMSATAEERGLAGE